jgi:hypothetical protein
VVAARGRHVITRYNGRVLRRLLILILVLMALPSCGGAPTSYPPSTDTAKPEAPDIASADPQVAFFHERLVNNGEDLQSDFGGFLTTLGLNPRDLQQDDPEHAYDMVLEKVRGVEDASLRADMMRTFFNRIQ